ncbi:Collagen alpha-1(XXII) chain [Stylophora pistillata]|uniref:Collagen alpha-1(XXII) chain n=1 Tax=Stylophora pistillata TaxID=50429 RepID=A0A2B4SHS3_STYPI|nr:Collagen alpha-1(XXII) chain [Stylophora pistillata]
MSHEPIKQDLTPRPGSHGRQQVPYDCASLRVRLCGVFAEWARRSVLIKYDIYTLDYFIELVEKIERDTSTSGDTINKIVNYVRLLGYNTDLWNIVCGKADPLPDVNLNSEERRILTNMVRYIYEDQSKQELGVVLTPDGETIAMGRVLLGICAGLNRDNSLSLSAWASGAPLRVDNLFTATIAYSLGRSALYKANGDTSDLFGPSGVWSPDTNCPASYRLTKMASKATDAELLGDVDGFLLGYGIPQWKEKGVRLGQLLRMYYGSGILYDTSYARCRRSSKFSSVVNKDNLLGEINGFATAYYDKNSAQLSGVKQGEILSLSRDINDKFFPYLDCEIPANIVFVMDESGSVEAHNHKKEKQFVREIIKTFDISPLQTRVAIVEFSTSVSVAVALDNYGSKTRLMCAVNDITYSTGYTYTGKALKTVHYNVLRPALDNPVTDTETVQIVIVLTDGRSNDPGKNVLKKAVKNLKKDIKDLTMIAVGVANYLLSELRLIATDEKHHVFTAANFDKLPELVSSLRTKACSAPIYMGLNFTESEDSTEVVAFVSPDKARFFTLSAEHFFGVEDIFIDVIPQYGTVSVYASRITDTPGPDNHTLKVGPAGEGQEMQLQFSNLCAGRNIY